MRSLPSRRALARVNVAVPRTSSLPTSLSCEERKRGRRAKAKSDVHASVGYSRWLDECIEVRAACTRCSVRHSSNVWQPLRAVPSEPEPYRPYLDFNFGIILIDDVELEDP